MFATVVCSAAATGVVPKLPAKQIPRETKSKRLYWYANEFNINLIEE